MVSKQRLWSLSKEKKLAEEVRKRSIIYSKVDRINDGRKIEDDAVPKAWEEVANVIGKTVPETMGAFHRLKKRYLEKRTNLRKLKHNSGGRTEKVEKAEQALAEYDFISWVMDFTVERSIKLNNSHIESAETVESGERLIKFDEPHNESVDGDNCIEEENTCRNGFSDDCDMNETHIVYPSNFSRNEQRKCDLPSMVSKAGVNRTRPRSDLTESLYSYTSGQDTYPIQHVTNTTQYTMGIPRVSPCTDVDKAKCINTSSASNNDTKRQNIESNNIPQLRNTQLIFGEMVAAELTELSSERRNHAKHEINNILYKYRVDQEEEKRLKQN